MNSSEVYLYLVGPNGSVIEGDVEARHYEKQIALSSWSWGAEIDAFSRSDEKSEQIKSKTLDFSKVLDASSTTMMNLLESGEVCKKATITMLQRTERSIALRVAMHGVRFIDMKLNVDTESHQALVTEDWTVNFDKVEIFYKAENTQNVGVALNNRDLVGAVTFDLTMPPGHHLTSRSNDRHDGDALSEIMGSDVGGTDVRLLDDDVMFGYE